MTMAEKTLKSGAILPLCATLAGSAAGAPPAAREAPQPGLAAVVQLLESGGSPVRIVCFGDSITGVYYHTGGRRAWCDLLGIALQHLYPKARLELRNAGVSGNRTAAGLARMDRDVLAFKPHLVVVMFGMNDCAAADPASFQNNLKTIVDRCRAAGAAVILCTPNSIYPEDKVRFANLPAHAEAVRALAAEMAVPLADCYLAWENLRASDPLAWKLLMSETIHPCLNGHRLLARTIAEAISGQKPELGGVPPPAPALTFTLDRLSRHQPVRVIAMPPFDAILPDALRAIYPKAAIALTPWPLGTLAELETWSQGIRAQKPTLVVVAVPAAAQAAGDEAYIRSYNGILNGSLAFGAAQWDTIAILPSVAQGGLTGHEARLAGLARQIAAGKDLDCLERAAGDDSDAKTILQHWLEAQHRSWTTSQAGRRP